MKATVLWMRYVSAILVMTAMCMSGPAYVRAQGGGSSGAAGVNARIAALEAAVAQLSAALDAESAARQAAETALQAGIDAVSSGTTVPAVLTQLASYITIDP